MSDKNLAKWMISTKRDLINPILKIRELERSNNCVMRSSKQLKEQMTITNRRNNNFSETNNK